MATNPNTIQQIQERALAVLEAELSVCDGCKKGNRSLFACSYNGCDQLDRVLCQKCGTYFHDEEQHQFDPAQAHIRSILIALPLDEGSKKKTKKNAKQMDLMVNSMNEEKMSGIRATGVGGLAFGANAVNQMFKVVGYVRNDAFFANAFTSMSTFLQNGQIESFGSTLKTVLFDVGDFSLEATSVCKEGAMVAGAALFVCELCYQTYRWGSGQIGLKQYGQKVLTAAGVGLGSMIGNMGGSAVGAAIGTFICPGLGTSIGSALGGLLGALFVGAAAKKSIEEIAWFNDKNEQAIRNQMIKEALIAFGFQHDDINDPDVFNELQIAKKYRNRSKEAHPDRGGSAAQFQKLNGDMALLMSLLPRSKAVKKEVSKAIQALAITL